MDSVDEHNYMRQGGVGSAAMESTWVTKTSKAPTHIFISKVLALVEVNVYLAACHFAPQKVNDKSHADVKEELAMALINNSWLAESEQNAQAPTQVSAADNDLRYFKKHPNPKTRLQCKGRNGNCGVRTTFICSKCSAPRAEKTSSDGKRILSGYVAMCRGCYKSHPCGKRVVFQRPTRQRPRPNTILSLDMRSSGEEESSDSDMCSADLSDDEQSDGSVSVNDSEIERLGNYSDSEIEHSESEAVQEAREAMGQVNVQGAVGAPTHGSDFDSDSDDSQTGNFRPRRRQGARRSLATAPPV
jgi:hypothetical protein